MCACVGSVFIWRAKDRKHTYFCLFTYFEHKVFTRLHTGTSYCMCVCMCICMCVCITTRQECIYLFRAHVAAPPPFPSTFSALTLKSEKFFDGQIFCPWKNKEKGNKKNKMHHCVENASKKFPKADFQKMKKFFWKSLYVCYVRVHIHFCVCVCVVCVHAGILTQ